jgi:tRNA-uridine 2-sulfurtransferase
MKRKAIALFSGGLDSTLAVLVIQKQNIDVLAITFLTDFGCDAGDTSSCSKNPGPAAAKFGFDLKLSHLGRKFVEIVKKPRHGHGRNMNPCIDCRILMLREAAALMEMVHADFVITGEVLGQRPMSQQRNTLDLIERESGLKGHVVRPLSARLLPITVPEARGIIDRDRLLAMNGRTRKPQMALARELGLTDYPAPAGGCLLTDPIYSRRLQDLLNATPDPDDRDLGLLRLGRHFRPSTACKIIVGRNEAENTAIEKMQRPGDALLYVDGAGSPLVLLTGPDAGNYLDLAASLCARYSDKKIEPEVPVTIMCGTEASVVQTRPAGQDLIERYRIG